MEINKLYIGIDVSKYTLDIYYNKKSYKIANNKSSISKFIKEYINPLEIGLCVIEPTGGYERVLKSILIKSKIPLHIAHPLKVVSYGRFKGHFAKTDKLDALLLHNYAIDVSKEETGDIFQEADQEEIWALNRLSTVLEENLHRAQCQIKQMPDNCKEYLEEQIKFYKKQIKELQEKIDSIVANNKSLKKKKDILVTMKGVGNKISSVLLCEMPELGSLSKRKISNLLGVVPKNKDSGKKKPTPHIIGGRFYARKSLYMAALVAVRYEPKLKEKYKKLLDKGKEKKVALVAIMHDIIISLNAMIKKMENCNFL